LFSLLEGLKAFLLDGAVVDEAVLAAVPLDEAVALFVAEPLYSPACHETAMPPAVCCDNGPAGASGPAHTHLVRVYQTQRSSASFFRELPNDFFLSYRRLVEAATPPLAGSAGPTLVPRDGTPPSGRARAPPSVALQRGTARSPAGSADAIGSRKADWQGWGFPL